MNAIKEKKPLFSLPLRFAIGVVLIVLLSLLIFYMVMNPPANDIYLMAGFLSITAGISTLAGYAAYRIGWVRFTPTIRWTLLGAYALSSLLTFLNVWVTARLMFASQHDLLLATVLLVFAGGIAMVLGYFFSTAITDRIHVIDRAARKVAEGNLDTRIEVSGKDEMSELAATFNEMASQLQAASIRQEEMQKLRRDLIAWVSHDLQTPLASIRAMVEALSDGMVEDPQTVQRYLHTVQREIGDLSVLIDELFQMAQMDAGGLTLKSEPSSLSDLISDTLESFSELANRKQVTLQGRVGTDVDPVWMDVQMISRVLNNLTSNALRYIPRGGTVEVLGSRSPDGVMVEVIDNGDGIPPEDLALIFERFYRGEKSRSRATGGAGLGLAIAKGIVEKHNGQIGVESKPGKTRFWFVLSDEMKP
jgi:signal transduction histidine kinase